ncbi:MAG: protein-glutamate O-methyltransferase CheR [Candidatus Eisenbacteria bacterium]|nr:protein-glutamate O-methyltransferase CheR [Candidatus Eisenbacteria bacterium]
MKRLMDFDEFLKETASLFGLQWRPFKRRGVKRKIERRIAQIGLSNLEEYLLRIKADPAEQNHLLKTLTVTISRFFRDREVFQAIGNSVIPTVLKNRDKKVLKIWSIGCASGEEPYSLSLLWKRRFEGVYPGVHLAILATEVNENLIHRAEEGRYKKSSVKEVPGEILSDYFKYEDHYYFLDWAIRESVEFRKHNILEEEPFSGMDMVFCRNLAFTYFSKETQIDVLKKVAFSLKEEGYLVIGKDEFLPLVYPTLFMPLFLAEKIYQKFNPNQVL